MCRIVKKDANLAVFMIDHYIVRFDITMHNALRVAVIECLGCKVSPTIRIRQVNIP